MQAKGILCALGICAVAGWTMMTVGGCGIATRSASAETSAAGNSSNSSNSSDYLANNNDADLPTGQPVGKTIPCYASLDQTTAFSGWLESDLNWNVCELGPAQAGDHFALEALGIDGFNPVLGLLTADDRVIYINDDRSYYSGLTDSRVRLTLHSFEDNVRIVVGSSPLAHSSGAYELQITLTQESPPAEPAAAQVVYLNFHGASGVRIGSRSPVDVPPFNGAQIDARFSESTEQIVDLVTAKVQQDFVGLDVAVFGSYDYYEPEVPHTTIHFGTYDPLLLGVAENIDEFNEQLEQQAIVFTDTFSAFSVLDPSEEEIAQALSNVASHELGHLLGLYHVKNPQAIMDITATLREMTKDQMFVDAPLNADTFPMGYQDAPAMLLTNVGGNAAQVQAAAKQVAERRAKSVQANENPGPPGPARARFTFSSSK